MEMANYWFNKKKAISHKSFLKVVRVVGIEDLFPSEVLEELEKYPEAKLYHIHEWEKTGVSWRGKDHNYSVLEVDFYPPYEFICLLDEVAKEDFQNKMKSLLEKIKEQ